MRRPERGPCKGRLDKSGRSFHSAIRGRWLDGLGAKLVRRKVGRADRSSPCGCLVQQAVGRPPNTSKYVAPPFKRATAFVLTSRLASVRRWVPVKCFISCRTFGCRGVHRYERPKCLPVPWALHQRSPPRKSTLEQVLFPLGGLTKPEVRSLAAQAGLPVAQKRESMGVCFVGKRRSWANFISQYITPSPGRAWHR